MGVFVMADKQLLFYKAVTHPSTNLVQHVSLNSLGFVSYAHLFHVVAKFSYFYIL
jgi:hypothetical protein